MQQRYYDPVALRFLSPDPVDVSASDGGNFNRYWYANNNPYRYVDPDGRFANFVFGFVVGFGVDAGIQYVRTGEVNIRQSLVSGLAGSLTGGVGGALTKSVGAASISATTAVGGIVTTGAVAGTLATAATATVTGQELTSTNLVVGSTVGAITSVTGAASGLSNATRAGNLARIASAPISSPGGVGVPIAGATASASRAATSTAIGEGVAAGVSDMANEAAGKVIENEIIDKLETRLQ